MSVGLEPKGAIEVLLIIDETLDAFFQLPIQMQKAMLSELLVELD